MTLEELTQKIDAIENLSASYYDKFETVDNVASELRDVLDDWGSDEEFSEPDIEDFVPSQIEDYHFECLAYSEAQERIAGYPNTCEEILKRVPV